MLKLLLKTAEVLCAQHKSPMMTLLFHCLGILEEQFSILQRFRFMQLYKRKCLKKISQSWTKDCRQIQEIKYINVFQLTFRDFDFTLKCKIVVFER